MRRSILLRTAIVYSACALGAAGCIVASRNIAPSSTAVQALGSAATLTASSPPPTDAAIPPTQAAKPPNQQSSATPGLAPIATLLAVPSQTLAGPPTATVTSMPTDTPTITATPTPTPYALSEFEGRLSGWHTYLEQTVTWVTTTGGGECRAARPQGKRISLAFDPSGLHLDAGVDPTAQYPYELWGGEVRPPGDQISHRLSDSLTRQGPNRWQSDFSPVALDVSDTVCSYDNVTWYSTTWRQTAAWYLEFTPEGFVVNETRTSISLEPVPCLLDELILHSSSCDVVYILQE